MTECKHGLELSSCVVCSPPPEPVVAPKVRAPRATASTRTAAAPAPAKRTIVNRDSARVHVVVPFEDFEIALEDGELIEPTYFLGQEESAWLEKRRARDIAKQVVLVSTLAAVAGKDELHMDTVQLVVVANTATQERARALLARTPYKPRVSVHPAWFTPPED